MPVLAPFLPGALAQTIRGRHSKWRAGEADVLLVRGNPEWDLSQVPTEPRVELRSATSVLAMWELLAEHADLEGNEFLVIVTDVTDPGPEVLGQVVHHKIYEPEPWDAVREAFGATAVDPALFSLTWAAEALLDVTTAGRPLGGGQLSLDTALAFLASRRLSVPGFTLEPDGLDIRALLEWTRHPGGLDRLQALRAAERGPLSEWLVGRVGRAARPLFAAIEAGHGADAVALGVLSSVLWDQKETPAPVDRARGWIERYFSSDPATRPSFGGEALTDEDFAAFGSAARDFVRLLPDSDPGRRRLLSRADHLAGQGGAGEAASFSTLLPSGLRARYESVARALDAALPSGRKASAAPAPATVDIDRLSDAVDLLGRHQLADDYRVDLDRISMALRLVRWLAEPETDAATVAAAIGLQVNDGGWVDRALYRISGGTEMSVPSLSAAFAKLAKAVATRRKARDEQFAALLAAWTAAGTEPGSLLTVESFVSRILGPLRKSDPGFLFVLIDGMSAAVAADLGEELRRDGLWNEYDPLAGSAAVGLRRGMAAALPTLTRISRASLFAGEIADGGQDSEKAGFPRLPVWGGAGPKLFHKGDLRADVGSRLGADLQRAMDEPRQHVAVVLNTVDDLLDDQRTHSEPWRIGAIDKLRDLLDQAVSTGRPVVIAADHGHMLDLGSASVAAAAPGSARHRLDAAPAGPGEVELVGPRVAAPGERIVALWDTDLRYGNQKTGYHGGVSLAEFAIPILALMPAGLTAPKGWAPVSRIEPVWSDLRTEQTAAAIEPAAVARTSPAGGTRLRVSEHQESLLDVVEEPVATSPLEDVLASELFKQRAALARTLRPAKIEKALSALVAAGGVLPTAAVAAEAGELPARARGFAASLRRVLNVDGEAVLSELDHGVTLKLDLKKLHTQFLGNVDR